MDEYSTSKNQRRKNLKNKKNNYKAIKGYGKSKKKLNPSSQALVDVYENTIAFFSRLNLKKQPSELIDISNEIECDTVEKGDFIVITENCDTLDMAGDFATEGLNPLVLNMASEYVAGGGVRSGKSAQEECLFRRTNAFDTHPVEWYPLEPNQIIFSPKVIVIKDSNYNLLNAKEFFKVGMMTVAGIRKPRLIDGEYDEEDRELMKKKIDSIFKVAATRGYNSLVLGALGCGVFQNPPHQVAALFSNAIRQYGGHFKKIGFAVLSRSEEESENLKEFKKLATK